MNRCVDIVVGLAAGSEAKGKVVSLIAHRYGALVRTGGPNAAHTVYFEGNKAAFHQIPCGSLHAGDAKLVLGAAAQIDIEYLKKEIDLLKKHGKWLDSNGDVRLFIDHNATIIDLIDKIAENGGRMPDCGDLYFHPRDCMTHNRKYTNEAQFFDVSGGNGGEKQVTKEAGTCMGCPMLPKDSAWAALGSTTHGAGANMERKMARGTKMIALAGQKLNIQKLAESVGKGDSTGYEEVTGAVVAALEKNRWSEAIEPQPVRRTNDDPFLAQFATDTVVMLNKMVDKNIPVMLEGTQGFILSLHHGYWPKTTSRDTNAANWCMESGISPLVVRDVIGVTRTFPIRVAGDSGPMSGTEIDWDEITEHATGQPIKLWRGRIEELKRCETDGTLTKNQKLELDETLDRIAKIEIVEVTTATKRKRRVFTFGEGDFTKALMINRPTVLALTFLDYLNIEDMGKDNWDSLSQRTRDWVTTLESKLGVHFKYLSTGPESEATVVRPSNGELAVMVQANR